VNAAALMVTETAAMRSIATTATNPDGTATTTTATRTTTIATESKSDAVDKNQSKTTHPADDKPVNSGHRVSNKTAEVSSPPPKHQKNKRSSTPDVFSPETSTSPLPLLTVGTRVVVDRW
jgi:hypothetical protein